MPTRKQRRRTLKERRHEYETVWVDSEGNELDDPPEDADAPAEKRNGAKPNTKSQPKKTQQQRGGRAARVPLPPSWRRAAKRGGLFGAVIFLLFGVLERNIAAGLIFGVIYTAIFIPFTFYLDRFSYNRWQRREQEGKKPVAKKR